METFSQIKSCGTVLISFKNAFQIYFNNSPFHLKEYVIFSKGIQLQTSEIHSRVGTSMSVKAIHFLAIVNNISVSLIA